MNLYNTEYERDILLLMVESEKVRNKAIFDLKPDDFWDDEFSYIFKLITKMVEDKKDIDMVTVGSELCKIRQGLSTKLFYGDCLPSSNYNSYYQQLKKLTHLRNIKRAAGQIVEMADSGMDVDIIKNESDKLLCEALLIDQPTSLMPVKNLTVDSMLKLQKIINGEKGVSTQYKSLDDTLVGYNGNELIIIAARPSIGKSQFMINGLYNMACAGIPVGIFSLEMSINQILFRIYSNVSDLDFWKFKSGKFTESEVEIVLNISSEINKLPLYIDDTGGMDIDQICNKIKVGVKKYGLKLIAIHYLSYIRSYDKQNRNTEIEDITHRIKSLSKDLNIPIILLSQLSREVDKRFDKIPVLSDLRDSGAIEQDADIVIMLYRDDYYNENSEKKNILDVYIRKARDGAIGHTQLLFLRNKMRITDIPAGTGSNF